MPHPPIPAPPDLLPLAPNRVWRSYLGGRELDAFLGQASGGDGHFPEDWMASATPASNPGARPADEGLSRVRIGDGEYLLRDVLQAFPERILGEAHVRRHGPVPGFLAKLLDSAVRLHLQSHPTAAFARERLGSPHGKTEAYVILATRPEIPEPYIHLGFQRPPAREDFRRAVLEQDEATLLGGCDRIPVRAGDAFVVPGGLPHAIGPGVLMLEVMEPTDFVARFEAARGGYTLPDSARYMGRDLDFALAMTEFRAVPRQEVRARHFQAPILLRDAGDRGREWSLVDGRATPCFTITRRECRQASVWADAGFHLEVVVGGRGRVAAGGASLELARGSRFLVPHGAGQVAYLPEGRLDILCVRPPAPG